MRLPEQLPLLGPEVHPLRTGPPDDHLSRVRPKSLEQPGDLPDVRTAAAYPVHHEVDEPQAGDGVVERQPAALREAVDDPGDVRAHVGSAGQHSKVRIHV